ncbi:Homeodomain-interacting protein kinase 2 [Takifugu flavidus]|uniref:Homeodomain-interacting protein kinase 2 n=1 Tax=Takifugu flavidus TaxID=433684 RepID=A0A5C6MHF8_9TELE|nr:Homeodomain-interacting protein kinase 2 [Takifugu flavidus]
MAENDFRPLPLEGIRLIVQQLAVALQSLRSVGLTHCDIKLDNIMLVDHEKQPFRIKLIDFGLADVASSIPQGSVIQALSYRSPEVLLGLPLTEAVDMWSLGCVVGELHLGDRLFDGNNEYDMTHLRTAGDKLLDSLDDLLSAFRTKGCENPDLSLFVDMLKKMLDLDPATRITPAQLLQHGFLTNTEVGTTCEEPEVTASKKNGQSLQSQCEYTQHNQASQLKTGQKRKHDYKDDDPTCHDSKRPKIQSRIQALLKLKNLDPEICNVVQIHAAFFDRGYFCFVFEYLDKSLFDYMAENDFRPLPLEGIRLIVQQLAVALQSLRSVGLTHCDIKLDNIMLVDHEKQPFRIKLIDFGLADVASSIPQGSVIQALSYRSPEVLLGLPLTEAVDMWSLGCVVGELHLGDRLFDGNNEYDMMRSIVELLGQPPNRMLDAGIKTNQYFKKSLCPWNRSWKLKTHLRTAGDKLLDSLDDLLSAFRTKGCENPDLSLFVDMLKKMLDLDPATRITPAQLLQHGFLTNTE